MKQHFKFDVHLIHVVWLPQAQIYFVVCVWYKKIFLHYKEFSNRSTIYQWHKSFVEISIVCWGSLYSKVLYTKQAYLSFNTLQLYEKSILTMACREFYTQMFHCIKGIEVFLDLIIFTNECACMFSKFSSENLPVTTF